MTYATQTRGHILTFLLTLHFNVWFCLDPPTGAGSNQALQNWSSLIFAPRPPLLLFGLLSYEAPVVFVM
jgi:hypothetical protein